MSPMELYERMFDKGSVHEQSKLAHLHSRTTPQHITVELWRRAPRAQKIAVFFYIANVLFFRLGHIWTSR